MPSAARGGDRSGSRGVGTSLGRFRDPLGRLSAARTGMTLVTRVRPNVRMLRQIHPMDKAPNMCVLPCLYISVANLTRHSQIAAGRIDDLPPYGVYN